MKIAVIQIRTEKFPRQTLAKAEEMVRTAAANNADIVVLPELFACSYNELAIRGASMAGREVIINEPSRWARELKIYIVVGSFVYGTGKFPGTADYNASCVMDRKGLLMAEYNKIHLFDVDLPNMRFHESDKFIPGNEITVFDTEFGKMGLAICYDLRFPELFRAMALRGAQVIFLPAKFSAVTGPDHWELLLRARALDNGVFVVGAAAARDDDSKYECWGHSTVTDPYGAVISTCDEKEQILYCDIDLERIAQVRARIPTLEQLRRDVYKVAD